jgi:hypothetical protein
LQRGRRHNVGLQAARLLPTRRNSTYCLPKRDSNRSSTAAPATPKASRQIGMLSNHRSNRKRWMRRWGGGSA